MVPLPLHHQHGLLFLELAGQPWLFDTGSPASFGPGGSITLAGRTLAVAPLLSKPSKPILTAPKLTQLLGVPCGGLLGMDIIGQFDWSFDVAKRSCKVTAEMMPLSENSVALTEIGGAVLTPVRIRDRDFQWKVCTGLRFSYLEDALIESFPPAGKLRDTHYHFLGGGFQTDGHHVPVSLAAGLPADNLSCGRLPLALRKELLPDGCAGALGAEFFARHFLGFAPRRKRLAYLTAGE